MEAGEWKIKISKENAISMGVDEGTYDFYQKYINRLNIDYPTIED